MLCSRGNSNIGFIFAPGTIIVGFVLSCQLYEARDLKSFLRTSEVDDPEVSSVRRTSRKTRFEAVALVIFICCL